MSEFGFTLIASDGAARRGQVTTAHGVIDTPAFMPVGTAATVKGILPESVAASGAQILLGNTYHLMLRPGSETIAKLGGLHKFMNWQGPILTDSGGFQVMSLADLRKITESGVTFRSHIDGTAYELTPERSIEIQDQLDANITMVLDECTPYPCSKQEAADSMRLSLRWAARSKAAFRARPGYGLFGIVQGSVHEDLRQESAQGLVEIGFDGHAIGGLAVGEGQAVMLQVLDYTAAALPADRPRYLMGVGKPEDILESVRRGVDMFDCVLPTRCGRTGQGFTRRGTVNLRNARHKEDPRPVDPDCPCPACADYSRAYLHHLFRAGEMLGPILLTTHNLYYFQELMADLRQTIEAGQFESYAEAFTRQQGAGDLAEI